MRVGVTGAEGFTGVYAMAALRSRGHEAVSIVSDITEAEMLRDEIARLRPDAVLHLAAIAFVHSENANAFYEVNQLGTFNLLAALAHLRPGAAVLLASSAQVYGAQSHGLLDEDQPLTPANHYGASKAAMELGAQIWGDSLRIIIARPFNYTGRGQEGRYLIPKIVAHYRDQAPRIELGNIDVRREFGDVRCVVDAYCRLIERSTPGTYNVATGELQSVRDILEQARALTGHKPAVIINPAFVRANDVPVLGGDNSRLRSALPDWQPQPFVETLRWMLAA